MRNLNLFFRVTIFLLFRQVCSLDLFLLLVLYLYSAVMYSIILLQNQTHPLNFLRCQYNRVHLCTCDIIPLLLFST